MQTGTGFVGTKLETEMEIFIPNLFLKSTDGKLSWLPGTILTLGHCARPLDWEGLPGGWYECDHCSRRKCLEKGYEAISEPLNQRVKNLNGLEAAHTLQNSKFDVFQAAEKTSKWSSVSSVPGRRRCSYDRGRTTRVFSGYSRWASSIMSKERNMVGATVLYSKVTERGLKKLIAGWE